MTESKAFTQIPRNGSKAYTFRNLFNFVYDLDVTLKCVTGNFNSYFCDIA
jgi:hypothetical protein